MKFLHSKKLSNKCTLILGTVLLMTFESCVFDNELDRFPVSPEFAGKWYYRLSRKEYTEVQFRSAESRDEIYYVVAPFYDRMGRFTVDTYVNNQLVRHQIIVNKDLSEPAAGFYVTSFKDEKGDGFNVKSDSNIDFDFAADDPPYFFNSDFPESGYGVQNYFVKYTDMQ